MIVLAHRGLWKTKEERNSLESLDRALSAGFGIETDVRDFGGRLVISHDMAREDSPELRSLLSRDAAANAKAPIALNIKADTLHGEVKRLVEDCSTNNYFVFDMSVPDGLHYLKSGLPTFTRQSEYEQNPSFYDQAAGIWMDEFEVHWISRHILRKHADHGKKVCIVSPELHGRSHEAEWEDYRNWEKEIGTETLMLCTDKPLLAREFFDAAH